MTDKQKTQRKASAKAKRNGNTVRHGEINYIDSSSLSRPMTMPKKSYPLLLAVAAAAILIAAIAVVKINYDVVHGEERLKAQVTEIANRGIDTSIPKLTDYVDYSDADFTTFMNECGCAYVDMNQIHSSSDFTVDYFKLPEDMTIEEGKTAYTEGISTLESKEAAKLLSGSWRLTVNRSGGFSYNVRFADFESATPNAAIQKAIEQQGLEGTTFTDNGKDGSGNTFQSGELELDGYYYTWTVSACKLKDVYRVDGLPADSQYVGVRLNYDRSKQ